MELLDYHIFKKDNLLVVVIVFFNVSRKGMKSADLVVSVTDSRPDDLDSNISPSTWASSQHPWQVLTYRWSGLPGLFIPSRVQSK